MRKYEKDMILLDIGSFLNCVVELRNCLNKAEAEREYDSLAEAYGNAAAIYAEQAVHIWGRINRALDAESNAKGAR